MRIDRRVGITGIAFLLLSTGAAGKQPAPTLQLLATYDTGLGADGSEIISVRHTDGIAVVTNIAGSVDVLDLSNPDAPERLRRVDVDTSAGTPNSAAVHPHHDYFLVVLGRAGQQGEVAAYRLSDGSFIASGAVGIQPDSIAISPNGQHAVIANEAEAEDEGLNGGEGSLSIVNLAGFDSVKSHELEITNIALPSQAGVPGFSTQRTDDIGRLAVDNTPATLEPESVAFSKDSRFAYVTLQENNGVVRLDVRTGELVFFGLGVTSHAADLTVDGAYLPNSLLTAFREPDGIALDQTGKIFVTADEGDTRNAAGSGSPRGGRTVSVFEARTGAPLGDTGSQLDDKADEIDSYPDSRSNRGGSEPEGLDLTKYRGLTLVAVGLERANAVALIDVSDPTQPVVTDAAPVGIGPEGIKFFRAGERLLVACSNEVSGTVSILEVVF
jgi:DNA-binding beta-propeller fold protein YncE